MEENNILSKQIKPQRPKQSPPIQTTKQENKNKLKFYITTSLVLLIIITVISIIIPISINNNRKILYNKLIYEMQYFDNNSINEIDSILSELPDNFKDVNNITNQYKLIRKHAKNLSEISTMKDLRFKEGTSNKLREAYAQLSLINNIDWNLENFLNSIKIELLIFDIKWENQSTSYSFKWSYDESITDKNLYSTIPSNKENGKSYYYTEDIHDDYIIFGYTNKIDSNEKFNAFKVSYIRYTNSKFYIDVYCYQNDIRYTFTMVE